MPEAFKAVPLAQTQSATTSLPVAEVVDPAGQSVQVLVEPVTAFCVAASAAKNLPIGQIVHVLVVAVTKVK